MAVRGCKGLTGLVLTQCVNEMVMRCRLVENGNSKMLR